MTSLQKKPCWVCGKPLGSRMNKHLQQSFSIVRDPGGSEHPCHHVCVKDADGRKVGEGIIDQQLRKDR